MTELKNIVFPGTNQFIINQKSIRVGSFELFYRPLFFETGQNDVGFNFYAVDWVEGHVEDNGTFPPDTIVTCIIYGWANFDGMKEINMGDDQTANYGYITSPIRLSQMGDLFVTLDALEANYCDAK